MVQTIPLLPPESGIENPPNPLEDKQEEKYQFLLDYFSKQDYRISGADEDGELKEIEKFWLSRECFLRFLRATKWDVNEAQKRLEDTLKWRREFGIYDITPEDIEPEAVTGKEVLLGYDNKKQPMFYMFPSRQNTEESPRQIQFTFYFFELSMDLMPPGIDREKMKFNPKVIEDGYINPDQLMKEWGGQIDFEYKHEEYWPNLMEMTRNRRNQWFKNWQRMGGKIGTKLLKLKVPDIAIYVINPLVTHACASGIMSMSFLSSTVKVARKDIFGEPSSNNFQDEEHSKLILSLGEILVDSLGDYQLVSKSIMHKANGNIAIQKESEHLDFPLFSWSTRPINLNPFIQSIPTSSQFAIEDTEREARHREERAKQVSIEGINVLKAPQYNSGSSKQRCSIEYVKPLTSMPWNSSQLNLIVAKKEPSEMKNSLEVLFPRTKCCPVIPVNCLEEVRGDSPSKRKRKRKRKRKAKKPVSTRGGILRHVPAKMQLNKTHA